MKGVKKKMEAMRLAEGSMDCWTLLEALGIPDVGQPPKQSLASWWREARKPYFRYMLIGAAANLMVILYLLVSCLL